MFSKKNKANRKDLEKIFQNGKIVRSENLTFRFILTSQFASPKVSFVIPKTTVRKVTARNLLRRRGYLALKMHYSTFPQGLLGVFIFNQRGAEIFGGKKKKTHNPTQLLTQEIKIILEKIFS